MTDDLALLRALAQGERAAFGTLYARFSERVYNTALSYTQRVPDAEEVTQDVCVKVYRGAAQFKGKSSVATWIYRITVNTALNALAKRKRRTTDPLDTTVPDFDHPGIALEKREAARELFRVIHTLPDSQKTAFLLSYVEELPRQEVADIMETTLKSVESLLQRAKHNLRKRLKNAYPHRRK